eukprot:Polyplicarium_translucidae@DN3346_c0_g3_i1.p1
MSCLLRTKSFSKDVPKMTVDDKLVRLLRRYSEGEVDVDKVVRRAKCLLSNDGGECHSQLKCRRQLKGGLPAADVEKPPFEKRLACVCRRYAKGEIDREVFVRRLDCIARENAPDAPGIAETHGECRAARLDKAEKKIVTPSSLNDRLSCMCSNYVSGKIAPQTFLLRVQRMRAECGQEVGAFGRRAIDVGVEDRLRRLCWRFLAGTMRPQGFFRCAQFVVGGNEEVENRDFSGPNRKPIHGAPEWRGRMECRSAPSLPDWKRHVPHVERFNRWSSMSSCGEGPPRCRRGPPCPGRFPGPPVEKRLKRLCHMYEGGAMDRARFLQCVKRVAGNDGSGFGGCPSRRW